MESTSCVSIVVPVYNQEEYLDEAVASLVRQSYSNLQIVLVNDGSTDASTQMLRNYARQDSRITLIEKENGGLVDATLAGIAVSTGEYLCFLDPDDLVGDDFVKTFMTYMNDNCDFVAAGYYTNNKGVLMPFPLKEDREFSADELRRYADSFLYEEGEPGISHRFFISRWNKFYRTELVKTVAARFGDFRHISLGEDTLFTYLVLNYSRGGRTLAQPNSYFYNVGNTKSMMKTGQVEAALKKATDAFLALKALTVEFTTSSTQAYALYGFLVDSVVNRVQANNQKQWPALRQQLRGDTDYRKARRMMNKGIKGLQRVKLSIKSFVPHRLFQRVKKVLQWLWMKKQHAVFWLKKCRAKGPVRATRLLGFQKDRENAFLEKDLYLPELEKRIYPILKPFLSETTDLDACALRKNIFVFWWDGFDHAPPIVQCCLRSVRQHHPGCNVIPIDRDNFKQYTDIHPKILSALEQDKISIQTFSDILRFNLLKNNGGVWVDATIFFTAEFNLLQDLEEKPFATLEFSTSADYFRYGEDHCTWSGFFIASRQNSLFARVVDQVFQTYFLTYGSYNTYFFIDIVMMLCKKYRLDGDVLGKTLYTNRSMFAITPLLGKSFDVNVVRFTDKIPQKLIWNVGDTPTDGTFYGWLLTQDSQR